MLARALTRLNFLANSCVDANCCSALGSIKFERSFNFNRANKVRFLSLTSAMANTRWEYVKTFETEDVLLPNCWAVARIDGRGFHKLAKRHDWKRPNDPRGLNLMNKAAKSVMVDFNEIILAYGQSDEYSFVFRREAEVFERRSAKIMTTLVSKFSAAFVFYWNNYFPDVPLVYPPAFDARIVLYPTVENLRDYLNWRQADCHINNLYNTTFWTLVQQGGLSNNDAQVELSGTLSADKNEILFSRFGINYNNEPEMYRKGTTLVSPFRTKSKKLGNISEREAAIVELNCDIIGDKFWNDYPYLLNPKILKDKENDKPERNQNSKENKS